MSSKTFGRPPYNLESEAFDNLQDEHFDLQVEHTGIQSDTDALQVVTDEIYAEVVEIDWHNHNSETWVGKSADQSGDDWAADNLTPFRSISGNGVYGADANDEAKVLGTDDTPVVLGSTFFDVHRLLIVGVNQDSVYKMRIVSGTGTMADAIIAKQYTEVMVKFDATNPQQSAGIPFDIRQFRRPSGTKIWVQCKNAIDNATIDFFVGFHEYPV